MTPFMETLRSVVTWVVTSIFGILTASFVLAFNENIKELLKQRGAHTILVRFLDALPEKLQDKWRWERVRGLWWLWAIFGLSGGVTLSLWLSPLLLSPSFIPPPPVIAQNPTSPSEKTVSSTLSSTTGKISDYDRDQMKQEIDALLSVVRNEQFQDSITAAATLHGKLAAAQPPSGVTQEDLGRDLIAVDDQIKAALQLFNPVIERYPQYDEVRNLVNPKYEWKHDGEVDLGRWGEYILRLRIDPTANQDVWSLLADNMGTRAATAWLIRYANWGKSLTGTLVDKRRKL